MSIPNMGKTDHTKEIQKEDASNEMRVLAMNPTPEVCNKNCVQDYTSDIAKCSIQNNASSYAQGSLPSLPESIKKQVINKSMPRLNNEIIGTNSSGSRRRKRKMDINKLTANLNKKDCIPRFKEGVRQQMERQRQFKGTSNNWYYNLEESSVLARKIHTASGKRNYRIHKDNSQNEGENNQAPYKIDEVRNANNQSHMKIEHNMYCSIESKQDEMLNLMRDAFNEYINSEECIFDHPNDYVEWSLSNLYSDIIKNELKEFNFEKDFKLLGENEVDYILDMMEARYRDFKRTDMIKPFHLKANLTFTRLSENIGLSSVHIEAFTKTLDKVDIDSTIKLLKKLKKLFYNRSVLVTILKDIKQRELYSTLIKDKIRELISSGKISDINLVAVESMKENLNILNDIGFRIISFIKNLYSEGLIFRQPPSKGRMLFKFSNKDYIKYINQDVNSLGNLSKMMEIIATTNEENPKNKTKSNI